MLCSVCTTASHERGHRASRASQGGARAASLLISLVLALFAVMLLATPPLALLTVPAEHPAIPPAPVHITSHVSQLA